MRQKALRMINRRVNMQLLNGRTFRGRIMSVGTDFLVLRAVIGGILRDLFISLAAIAFFFPII